MSMPEQGISLPATFLGDHRSFHMGFTYHGDILLQTQTDDEPVKRFGLAHSNEALLVAAGMGYYARLGVARAAIRAVFTEASQDLLSEVPANQITRRPSSHVVFTAENEPLSSRDDLPGGFTCLAPPVPAHPGTTEDQASTGVYTQVHETGHLVLVLASLPPHTYEQEVPLDEISLAEFCQEDILPITRIICDLAMGEYRQDIAALLYEFSGELDENI